MGEGCGRSIQRVTAVRYALKPGTGAEMMLSSVYGNARVKSHYAILVPVVEYGRAAGKAHEAAAIGFSRLRSIVPMGRNRILALGHA